MLSTHVGTHKADHKLLTVKARTALSEERVTAAALGAGAQGFLFVYCKSSVNFTLSGIEACPMMRGSACFTPFPTFSHSLIPEYLSPPNRETQTTASRHRSQHVKAMELPLY